MGLSPAHGRQIPPNRQRAVAVSPALPPTRDRAESLLLCRRLPGEPAPGLYLNQVVAGEGSLRLVVGMEADARRQSGVLLHTSQAIVWLRG